VIVVNNGNEDKNSVVKIDHPMLKNRSFIAKNLLTEEIKCYPAARAPVITWEVPRKDGAVFEISRKK
jgi:hypothetical protein